ncbi:hypothetical protein L1987_21041 [Smallanthus sonchifolius]|uniref:Uncharacterized protein n=1 Tax=Smallanthus sonchifolius TaxID=185202 RepID=A0ACB9ITJ7_9ASTR|nr:hypothetical protein L1987_21041 [Smallanthus sonchifolius]
MRLRLLNHAGKKNASKISINIVKDREKHSILGKLTLVQTPDTFSVAIVWSTSVDGGKFTRSKHYSQPAFTAKVTYTFRETCFLILFPHALEARRPKSWLSGNIPISLGQLSNLKNLDISCNSLVSETHFTKLENLNYLDLQNNRISRRPYKTATEDEGQVDNEASWFYNGIGSL